MYFLLLCGFILNPIFFNFFFETGFLIFGCPGTHSGEQVVFELTEIHLPLPPKYWDKRCHSTLNSQRSACLCLPSVGIKGMHYHTQLLSFFLFYFKDFIHFLFFFKPTYICKHPLNCSGFLSESIFTVYLSFSDHVSL